MIKVKEGEAKFKGTIPTLSTELVVLIKAYEEMLVKQGLTKEQARADVDSSVELARMTSDELQDKLLEELKRILG